MNAATIGIFGHYGHENLGDEAIIEACIQRIPEFVPGVRLHLYSGRPTDSEQRYGLPSFPIKLLAPGALSPREQIENEKAQNIDHRGWGKRRGKRVEKNPVKRALKRIPLLWPTLRFLRGIPGRTVSIFGELRFLLQSRKHVKNLDLLMVTGSNQFLDNFGGPWGFPFTLLKWTWLARSAGVPVAFVSVGAGPLDEKLSHRMIRLALRHASYLSFRDAPSRELVDSAGRFDGLVYPDLAFAIDRPAARVRNADERIVAINPMAVYDGRYWYIKDAGKYEAYIEKLALLVTHLIDNGYTPRLFATQVKDENVIEDVIGKLGANGVNADKTAALFKRLDTVSELLEFLDEADLVVPTRFHGTVLGLWALKPTIGICYYRKAADLLADLGQNEYAFDLDEVSADELCQAIDKAWSARYSITSQLENGVEQYRNLLGEQFRAIRGLVSPRD